LRLALALAATWLVACGDSGDVHILGGACPFATERTLSTLDGPMLDGIAVAAHGDGAYLVWSERSGLFGLTLSHDGAASGERERIGPSCAGGVDVIDDGTHLMVACSIQGDVERGDRGAVVVYARDAAWSVIDRRAGVGEGSGVSLSRGSSTVVAWQEATGASSAAWIATVGDPTDPLRLSRAGFRATAPVVAYEAETRLALWGELWIDERGDAAGRLVLQVGDRAPRPVTSLAYELPLPTITLDREGAILAFRDRRPARTRPALQLARITRETRDVVVMTGAPANAAGGGVAVACQGSVMVVAPRTHSRTERLVSVRRHDASLAGLGPEQQLYEHGSTFEWADAVCLGDRTLVVFGSRSSSLSPIGTVRSVTVDCARAPE
jgi:hypothetical protein